MQKFTRIAALLLVVVAIVLAVVAFSIGRRAVRPTRMVSTSVTSNTAVQPSTVAVVVAAAPLAAGTPVDAASLHVVQWLRRPQGAFGDVNAVVGGVPLVDIPAGTPLTRKLLARGVAMALKPGERAMALPVDEQAGAGNRILPGDYVDVFVSLKAPQTVSYGKRPVEDATQTRLLLSRLRVLAYGSDDLPMQPGKTPPPALADKEKARLAGSNDDGSSAAASGRQENAGPVPRTAVLAVPVGEADQLLLGVQDGKLSLALRSPTDQGLPDNALFPKPRPVLAARKDLNTDQKQQLAAPENRAFAGINGMGLAGHDPVGVKPDRIQRGPVYHRIEIIRGFPDDSRRAARSNR